MQYSEVYQFLGATHEGWLTPKCFFYVATNHGSSLLYLASYNYTHILVMIESNSSSMHHEYHDFYAVHAYLQSIRISLIVTVIVKIERKEIMKALKVCGQTLKY